MKKDKLFAMAANDWLDDVAGLNKYGTLKASRNLVTRLNKTFGHKYVSEITKEDIQRFVTRLNMTVGLQFIRHHLSALRGIMQYADDDWVMPRIKIPKRILPPKQELYSFEEVRKLLSVATGQYRGLIMLLAETGCRVGEALALQPGDITPTSLTINKNVYEGILQPSPKTISSIRTVAISKSLWYALEDLRVVSVPQSFLFQSASGRPAWPQQLINVFRELCQQVEVSYKAFHAFRRGNITECVLNLGMPEKIVGYRVGHQCEGMTLGVYTKAQKGCDIPWITVLEPYLYQGKGGYVEVLK